MFKFIFSFCTCFLYSQSNVLKIFSYKDNTLIENALIYSETDLLGFTNIKGEIEVKANFTILKIVKENFEDVEFSLNDLKKLNWKVSIQPIKFIELETVKILKTKENPFSILDKIKESRFKQNHKNLNYYQSKVEFKFDDIVIFLFNNIIYPSKGLKVNDKNEIIYKGYQKQIVNKTLIEVFNVFNNELQVPVRTSVYCSLTDFEISPIFDGKLYDYVLKSSEEYYILNFSPKQKNEMLLYEGYFIIDKYDFGIIELDMNLSKSNKNIWKTSSYDLKRLYEYNIESDSFKFKFAKIEDKYFLESSSRNLSCIQTKGGQTGKRFTCDFYNEETLNQEGLVFKDYDWILQKIK